MADNGKGGSGITVIRVVKKQKGHASHGGSWKVAYADFVTAMMAFFLVMWIMGMEESVKDMVQGYFNNPIGFKKAMSAGKNFTSMANSPTNMNVQRLLLLTRAQEREEFEQVKKQILKKLRSEPELKSVADQVQIIVTDEGLRIELVENAGGQTFFPIASATLRPAALRVLTAIAPELNKLSNGLVVEGHTDAVPSVRPGYSNWELSADRANAARRAVQAAGYDPAKILAVRGYADRDPRVPDNPYDPRNRRLTLLLPFRNQIPSIELGSQTAAATTATHEPPPAPSTPMDIVFRNSARAARAGGTK